MKSAGGESQNGKGIIVSDEVGRYPDDDHNPLTDEEGSLAAEVVDIAEKTTAPNITPKTIIICDM